MEHVGTDLGTRESQIAITTRAKHGDRVLRLVDGRVASDERRASAA